MQPVPDPVLLAAADGKRTTIAVELAIPTRDLALAEADWQHRTLADAALHLAEEEPNKAVAVLIGSALDAACRGDLQHAALAIGATVPLLQSVARSQLLGVVQ